MMAPTHVMVAVLLVTPLAMLFPNLAMEIFIAGFIGGVFPDFDLFKGVHRKSLHYPIGYSLGLGLGIIELILIGSFATIIITALFTGLVSHILGDIAGAGLEHEPWRKTSHRGVYNHIQQKWIRPRFIVGHDGSLRDLIVLISLTPLVYLQYSQLWFINWFIGTILVIGISYASVRKVLPKLEEYLYHHTRIGRILLNRFFYSEESDRPWDINN